MSISFDNKTYWERINGEYPPLKRMAFTLLSDSTFRNDLVSVKKGQEDIAQRHKIELEEIQRNDKKLREKFLNGIK